MDISTIFGYVLSYLIPIILFVVWARFLGGNYTPIMGIGNWMYFIISMITLTYNHRYLDTLLAVPLLLIVLGVIAILSYILAYFTGKSEGVRFWNSFIWKLIKITGHPLLIYPTIFIISLVFDLGLLPTLIENLRSI